MIFRIFFRNIHLQGEAANLEKYVMISSSLCVQYLRRNSRVNQEMQIDSRNARFGFSASFPSLSTVCMVGRVLRVITTVEITTNNKERTDTTWSRGHLKITHYN